MLLSLLSFSFSCCSQLLTAAISKYLDCFFLLNLIFSVHLQKNCPICSFMESVVPPIPPTSIIITFFFFFFMDIGLAKKVLRCILSLPCFLFHLADLTSNRIKGLAMVLVRFLLTPLSATLYHTPGESK